MCSPAQCFLSIKKKITWTDIWDIGVHTGKEDKQSWEDHKECKTDFSISTILCWEPPKSSFYKMKLILINLARKLAGYNSMLNPWCAGYSYVFQHGASFSTQTEVLVNCGDFLIFSANTKSLATTLSSWIAQTIYKKAQTCSCYTRRVRNASQTQMQCIFFRSYVLVWI